MTSSEQLNADQDVEKDLLLELEGILQWAIAGATQYLEHGLQQCQAVKQATENYRDECDIVNSFVRCMCILDADAEEQTNRLYQAFAHWAHGADYDGIPRLQDFVTRLEGQPGVSRAVVRIGDGPARQRAQARVMRGVRLFQPDPPAD